MKICLNMSPFVFHFVLQLHSCTLSPPLLPSPLTLQNVIILLMLLRVVSSQSVLRANENGVSLASIEFLEAASAEMVCTVA